MNGALVLEMGGYQSIDQSHKQTKKGYEFSFLKKLISSSINNKKGKLNTLFSKYM